MGRRIMLFFGLALAQIAAGCTDAPDSPLAAAAAADNVPELQRLLAGGAAPGHASDRPARRRSSRRAAPAR